VGALPTPFVVRPAGLVCGGSVITSVRRPGGAGDLDFARVGCRVQFTARLVVFVNRRDRDGRGQFVCVTQRGDCTDVGQLAVGDRGLRARPGVENGRRAVIWTTRGTSTPPSLTRRWTADRSDIAAWSSRGWHRRCWWAVAPMWAVELRSGCVRCRNTEIREPRTRRGGAARSRYKLELDGRTVAPPVGRSSVSRYRCHTDDGGFTDQVVMTTSSPAVEPGCSRRGVACVHDADGWSRPSRSAEL